MGEPAGPRPGTTRGAGRLPPDLGGYHLAFVVAAIAMVSGSVIASRVRDADAAATMAVAAEPESAGPPGDGIGWPGD
jgi:hypothetical protein